MPRARRPENARVRPVGRSEASAARCGAEVPASGQRMNAVPTWAAAAPAARTAATARPVEIPPVATSGTSDARAHELQQREQPVVHAVVAIDEGPAVTAGLAALDDERVRARPDRRLGLRGLGDGHPRHGAGRLHARERLRRRAAEGERHDADRRVLQQRELRLEGVVVEARPAERDAGALGLAAEGVRVARDDGRVGGHAGRREQVDRERPVGERAGAGELLGERLGREVSGGDEPEAARPGDRGRELRRGRPARHRGLDDRDFELVEHRAASRREGTVR